MAKYRVHIELQKHWGELHDFPVVHANNAEEAREWIRKIYNGGVTITKTELVKGE